MAEFVHVFIIITFPSRFGVSRLVRQTRDGNKRNAMQKGTGELQVGIGARTRKAT
jgi:hypothetical protein